MEFGVLGVLSVNDRGVDVAPTAPKQRQALALLLLNGNNVVSMAQLVEELWEGNAPPTAVAAVHTYVKQMRRAIGQTAADGRLLTRDNGYLFLVRHGELDLARFRAKVDAGRAAIARGDDMYGAAVLRTALNMWRTGVLVDMTPGPLVRSAIVEIERTWLAAFELRVAADLRLGRHHELIGELSGLVCQQPTHESAVAQLMVALYQSGRGADALAVFHRLRAALDRELDSAPSGRMHRLYTDILTAHPRLDVAAGARPLLSLDLATSRGAD